MKSALNTGKISLSPVVSIRIDSLQSAGWMTMESAGKVITIGSGNSESRIMN